MARTRTRTLESNSAEPKSFLGRRRREEEEYEEEVDSNGLTAPKDRPTPSARDLKPRGVGSTGMLNRHAGDQQHRGLFPRGFDGDAKSHLALA